MVATSQKMKAAERRRIVATEYLKGRFQSDIAQELGVSQGTISNDLKAIREQWQKSALIDFNEAVGRELFRIDQLEMTYWQSWQHSLKEFTSQTTKAKGARIETRQNDDGEIESETKITPIESSKRQEERTGDPRFLAGIQWCIDRRIKLLGLDARADVEIQVVNISMPDKLKAIYADKDQLLPGIRESDQDSDILGLPSRTDGAIH